MARVSHVSELGWCLRVVQYVFCSVLIRLRVVVLEGFSLYGISVKVSEIIF